MHVLTTCTLHSQPSSHPTSARASTHACTHHRHQPLYLTAGLLFESTPLCRLLLRGRQPSQGLRQRSCVLLSLRCTVMGRPQRRLRQQHGRHAAALLLLHRCACMRAAHMPHTLHRMDPGTLAIHREHPSAFRGTRRLDTGRLQHLTAACATGGAGGRVALRALLACPAQLLQQRLRGCRLRLHKHPIGCGE